MERWPKTCRCGEEWTRDHWPELPDGFGDEVNPAADLKKLNHSWIQAFNDRDWKTESALRGESFRAASLIFSSAEVSATSEDRVNVYSAVILKGRANRLPLYDTLDRSAGLEGGGRPRLLPHASRRLAAR